MGITDQPEAFYLDRATALFGLQIDAELGKAGEKHKTEQRKTMAHRMVLRRWLEGAPDG